MKSDCRPGDTRAFAQDLPLDSVACWLQLTVRVVEKAAQVACNMVPCDRVLHVLLLHLDPFRKNCPISFDDVCRPFCGSQNPPTNPCPVAQENVEERLSTSLARAAARTGDGFGGRRADCARGAEDLWSSLA